MKRVAIITGAAGGIGSAVVEDLLEAGYSVVGLVRSKQPREVEGAVYLVADVARSDEVDAAISEVLDRFGRIDVLVTTAAILRSAPVHQTSDELWDEVITTNLRGVFVCCRAVLPSMIAAGSGAVVNLSSVHAIATVSGTGAYAATKGAIVSLSRQMAVEYADNGIRVNSLIVGSVDTKMTDLHKELLERDGVTITPPGGSVGRMAHPAEIAKAVRFLAGDDSSFITGSALTIDGGLLSVLM